MLVTHLKSLVGNIVGMTHVIFEIETMYNVPQRRRIATQFSETRFQRGASSWPN
jgi:hypothetical protein